MKESTLVDRFTRTLKDVLPAVFNAMIEERNIFMSVAIMNQTDSRMLVGVVGLAHLAGMKQLLSKKGGFELIT